MLRNYKVEMLCVLYYGITSYAYLIFCFVRCIIKYLQPKNNNKNDDDKIKIEYKATPILEKSVTFPISLIIKLSREIDIESIDTYIPTY